MSTGYKGIRPFFWNEDYHKHQFKAKSNTRPGWRCKDCGNKISREQYYDQLGLCDECKSDVDRERRVMYRGSGAEDKEQRLVPDVAVQLGVAREKRSI